MARVFLSYNRDDTERARSVALALEKAGHSVWWDLHVRVGAEFSKAIEEALEAADVVVVLWSANSVESAWVRDEASVGRDTGRLVPVTIDGTQPPLGFRQFQTIDLPDRNGPNQLKALFDAVESLGDKETSVAAKPALKPARANFSPRRGLNPWLMFGLLVLILGLVVFVLGLIISRPWEAKASIPSVAVTASDPAAEPLARDLLVKLTTLQSAKSGSMQLRDSGATDAEFVFQVSADSMATSAASLMLLAGKDRSILWSEDFKQESGNIADLKQQASFTAARVLGCALDAAKKRRPGCSPDRPALTFSRLD